MFAFRANANERVREERTSTTDLFAGHQAKVREATIDEIFSKAGQGISAPW
jgi:hypothetical protein